MVRVGRFAWREFPQAQPQPLAAGLAAETGTQATKTGVLAWFVEDGVVDVGHRAEGICSLIVPAGWGYGNVDAGRRAREPSYSNRS